MSCRLHLRWEGIMRLSVSTLYSRHRPKPCELRIYLRLHGVPQGEPGPYDLILRDLGRRHEQGYLAITFAACQFTGQ